MNNNTIIIADLHAPFIRKDYLDFCRETADKYKARRVVFIGDLIDNHAISYHEHDSNGLSAGDEMEKAVTELAPWYKAFPEADWTIGNHDELPHRQGKTAGLPSRCLRTLREIYAAPKKWRIAFNFKYDNWIAQHGTMSSGDNGAFNSMLQQGISIVQGHIHTASGVRYHANETRLLWAMQVGTGLDRRQYAFAYGRDFKRKPLINCGVVLENGTLPIVIPMYL